MKKESIYFVTTPAPLLEFLLHRLKGQSRNSVKHLLSRGQVLVDGAVQRQFDLPLSPGQQVRLLPSQKGSALPFPILYEDEGLIAINKPAGLLSIATQSEQVRTAYRQVTSFLRGRDPRSRLFIVHRLDRDTSGVLLFAKNEPLKRAIQDSWSQRATHRGYWAVVEGTGLPDTGTCRSHLVENRIHRVYSSRSGQGKEAVTHYQVLARTPEYSLLDVALDTGRKNQIRVHLSELNHPVTGDKKYGAARDPMGRLALHAYHLTLTDPRSGLPLTLTAPPPQEFQRMFPSQFWPHTPIQS